MTHPEDDLERPILSAIRRIVRAIDLHSHRLEREHGITGPQLVALRAVAQLGPISVSALARQMQLSQPTVTGILARLDRQDLVRRERCSHDRRTIVSTATTRGARLLRDAPPLLQDRFRRELSRLADWERAQTLATLQRVADMMDPEGLPAEPLLATRILGASEDAPARADAAAASQAVLPAAASVRAPAHAIAVPET